MQTKTSVLILVVFTVISVIFIERTNLGLYTTHYIQHNCSRLSFSPRRLPKTALASFPGSGNTWFRHLLQKMTGIATGAVYRDTFLKRHGFFGEGKTDGSVVAIKTHYLYNNKTRYDRVILLVRNPYEAILAEFKRYYSINHNQTGIPEFMGYSKYWEKHLVKKVVTYKPFYLSWLRHKAVLPIFYDDLKHDLRKELSKTLSFLNISGDIWCATDDSEGLVHRQHYHDPPMAFLYSKRWRNLINDVILMLNEKFSERFRNQTFHMTKWLL